MACDLSRLDFDRPSAIISQKVVRVKWFPSGSVKFFSEKNAVWYYTRLLGFCQVKSSSSKKIFLSRVFSKILNFFRSFGSYHIFPYLSSKSSKKIKKFFLKKKKK